MRTRSILSIIIILWLVVGAIAAGQRGYFSSVPGTCNQAGTIAAAIAVGPLNYLGLNPQIACEVPQPSP
ncbi:hypothetical protein [Arthrobacter sp. 35W]|uniref:hypothetical protein n=1 Tax=Arthrobacter sp. 35W TaxID=1132441 RepID=UPI00041EE1D8|nr:hypothetical protein [Arthrobacter sp. 35W]